MNRPSPDRDFSAAVTIDASPSDLAASSPECRMCLVEGSGAHLTSETQSLLRSRLRGAALVLLAAFATFMVWRLVNHGMLKAEGAGPFTLTVLHLLTLLILGAISIALCRRCTLSLGWLRVAELAVFGMPALFFVAMGSFAMPAAARRHNILPTDLEPWILLIFVYALFIPNTWRRAAVVLGAISLMPIVLRLGFILFDEVSGAVTGGDWFSFGTTVLVLAVATVAAVAGVHTINNLRTEAFRARQLGQYRLKHLIGSGGMGEVYLAEHLLLKRPCAIKVIRPEKAGDPTVLARFEREVRASAKLSHWNSIDIFDYGRADDGTFYYVMEFLPGMSLQELVDRHGPLAAERVIHLLVQVCDALEEAHAMGIVHRDIKPANIFAAQRGGQFDVAKLLDFGLAKPVEASDDDVHLTQAGSVTGSPHYMSPEQATGDGEPDARSDVYSLGAVMYYLLAGRPPFDHGRPLKVLIAQASEEPQPLHALRADVPEDLELVVMRCLAKQPHQRYQTARELAAALAECSDAGRWTRDDAQQWWLTHGPASTPPELAVA